MFEPIHDEPDRSEGVHRHVLVRSGEIVAVSDGNGRGRTLTDDEAATLLGRRGGDLILGRLHGAYYWASIVDDEVELGDSHHVAGLRNLHGRLSDDEWNIAGRATQLLDWMRDHRFCGRCGGPMDRAPGERAMRCPRDGNTAYPRLSPAIIVLVERADGRALLGRSARWPTPMYSTLAGFVEPGETLEDTVIREVYEEVGVMVAEPRYVASQPWPFPNSLMLGFTAQWLEGEIAVDGVEIADAQWFAHDDLPDVPGPPSISNRLIADWIERQG